MLPTNYAALDALYADEAFKRSPSKTFRVIQEVMATISKDGYPPDPVAFSRMAEMLLWHASLGAAAEKSPLASNIHSAAGLAGKAAQALEPPG